LTKLDLEKLRSMRHPRADRIHELLDEPRRLIISILCGNELVNIASASNMAAILVSFFDEADTTWINILVMVPLLLLVGEVTPKTLAVTYPVMFATNVSARILPRWIALITPLREVVRFIADRITTAIVGEPVKKDNILHADEFRTLVEEGAASGALRATERILIDNMLEASETEVADIMTPGPRMVSLDGSLSLPELIAEFHKLKHPRVPLYLRHPSSIIGFLHSEDVIRLIHGDKHLDQVKVRDIIRPAHFIPSTKKVDEMVDYFQENNTRAALVIDEYGSVLGIVSIKDVAEFIFGKIVGPQQTRQYYQGNTNGDTYLVPGDMNLNDFNDLSGFGLDDPIMNTVGGVALRAFNRLPKQGEQVTEDGFSFTVEQMEGLRINSVRITRIPPEMLERRSEPGTSELEAPETPAPLADTPSPRKEPSSTEELREPSADSPVEPAPADADHNADHNVDRGV